VLRGRITHRRFGVGGLHGHGRPQHGTRRPAAAPRSCGEALRGPGRGGDQSAPTACRDDAQASDRGKRRGTVHDGNHDADEECQALPLHVGEDFLQAIGASPPRRYPGM